MLVCNTFSYINPTKEQQNPSPNHSLTRKKNVIKNSPLENHPPNRRMALNTRQKPPLDNLHPEPILHSPRTRLRHLLPPSADPRPINRPLRRHRPGIRPASAPGESRRECPFLFPLLILAKDTAQRARPAEAAEAAATAAQPHQQHYIRSAGLGNRHPCIPQAESRALLLFQVN